MESLLQSKDDSLTHRISDSADRVITMATADGMTSFLASIESNVKRFPEDQLSIYQCIRAVARRHGAFVGRCGDYVWLWRSLQ